MTSPFLRAFLISEDGAVTVDWVVLTAAIVGLGIGIFTIITRESVTVGANVVSDKLSEAATTDYLNAEN